MIDRRHIEQILRLNDLDANAPEEEIKSLLISARWHKDDVETALVVLKEDVSTKEQHVDTFHNVFNTDVGINPETLNSILGIDVDINSSFASAHRASLRRAYRMQLVSIVVVSIFLALLFTGVIMFFMKMGIFRVYL